MRQRSQRQQAAPRYPQISCAGSHVIVSDTFPRSAMFYVKDEQNAGLGEFLLLIGAVSIACPVHTGKLRPFPLARTIAEAHSGCDQGCCWGAAKAAALDLK